MRTEITKFWKETLGYETEIGIYTNGWWQPLSWFDGQKVEIGKKVYEAKPDSDCTVWMVYVDGEKYGFLVDNSAGCNIYDGEEFPPNKKGLRALVGNWWEDSCFLGF